MFGFPWPWNLTCRSSFSRQDLVGMVGISVIFGMMGNDNGMMTANNLLHINRWIFINSCGSDMKICGQNPGETNSVQFLSKMGETESCSTAWSAGCLLITGTELYWNELLYTLNILKVCSSLTTRVRFLLLEPHWCVKTLHSQVSHDIAAAPTGKVSEDFRSVWDPRQSRENWDYGDVDTTGVSAWTNNFRGKWRRLCETLTVIRANGSFLLHCHQQLHIIDGSILLLVDRSKIMLATTCNEIKLTYCTWLLHIYISRAKTCGNPGVSKNTRGFLTKPRVFLPVLKVRGGYIWDHLSTFGII